MADHDLFERLERFFSIPMLFIAVLILPVLAGEFIWTGGIAASATLRFALDLGTALIWVDFCVEFIVMSTVAPSKLGYIARNWINLAVILLPFLAFLRGVMALRLVWFAKLGTTLKVYRMRGLGMRAWRGLVALDLLERLSHRTPLARLTHLRGILREKEREVARLRRRIHHLEAEQGIADPAQDPAPQDPPPGPPPHAQSCRNPAASPP